MNHDLDPEKAIIGLAMTSKALDEIDLDPRDFADIRHEALWALLIELHTQGSPTDPLTVLKSLPRIPEDHRRGVDGVYLTDLRTAAPIAPLAHHYASMVANAATLRRLDAAGRRIIQLADAGGDAQEISETAVTEVAACIRATSEITMVADTIDTTIDGLKEPSTAIPTPWADLNRLIKGWRPGALYVVAARPGVGKSIIGLQAAFDLAKHGNVAFMSLEMPRREVEIRLIAQVAEVHLARLNGANSDDDSLERLSQRDWENITRHRAVLTERPLSIDDRSYVTVSEIRSYARTLARKGPLSALIVDYLQLISAPRGDRRPRHELVADISRSLKILAKELGCPVIALSQLNRQSEARADKKPTIADIRESGAVEQDADVILLLHMDEESVTDLDMLVAKNRQGAQGLVELQREGHFARATQRPWSAGGRAA